MNYYTPQKIRNVTLLGNSQAGKTTLAESFLFAKGIIDRKGEIESKNTVSDYNEVEQTHENSIFPSVIHAEHNDCKINFIDPPGLDDFVGGVISSLHVADAGLMILNAQNGVEVGTENQSHYLEERKKPLIFAINQLDHEKAKYDQTVEQLQSKFGNHVLPIQLPVNTGPNMNSIVDILTMKMYTYEGGPPKIEEIPDNLKDQAEELKGQLIEQAAESNENLMEKYFENESLTTEELQEGIKESIKERGLFPVLCLSALKDIGISTCLDFIQQAVPAPNEMPPERTNADEDIPCDPAEAVNAFIFKTSFEYHIGEINYFKLVSGELHEGTDLYNLNSNAKERLSQIYTIQGKNRNKVDKLQAGDIGAAVKLKHTETNHTLSSNPKGNPLKPIQFPSPKHRSAIRPVNEGEDEKLGTALHQLQSQDPTFRVEYNKELKQIIIHGQGEYHLDILNWHLDNIFKVKCEFVEPKIPYRETITKKAHAEHRHKKQSGGAGQFGEVYMVIEPYEEGMPDPKGYTIEGKEIKISVRDKEEYDLEWGGKLVFLNCIVGGAIDNRFMPAIVKGIMEKMENGPLTGCYARDIRVALYDGKMHPVDSNEVAFKTAGRNAFHKAFVKANPKILEPIYSIQVQVPSDKMGDVMSDLQSRRALVQGMDSEDSYEIINAKVPLAEMNKYSTALNSLTNGRATFTMEFSEYQQVSGDIQEKLLKEHQAETEEEE